MPTSAYDAPLAGTFSREDEEAGLGPSGLDEEVQPLVGAASRNPHDIKTCRICLQEEDVSIGYADSNNPLISPCQCSGSTRYVHRHCLERWRLTAGTGSLSFYRCEICHYKYELRRLWWGAVLRHPATAACTFILLALLSSIVLGYVPLVQVVLGTKRTSVITSSTAGAVMMHTANGVVMLGLIGFVLLALEACCVHACPLYIDPYPCYMAPDCCGPCVHGVSADALGGACAAGDEAAVVCGVLCLVAMAAAAVAGVLYLFFNCFSSLYARFCDGLGATHVLVENVGAPAVPYVQQVKKAAMARGAAGRRSGDELREEQGVRRTLQFRGRGRGGMGAGPSLHGSGTVGASTV